MTNEIKTSKRVAERSYLVTMTNGVQFSIYQSEAMWFAANVDSRKIVDCAPTKVELYRALESVEVAA